MAVAAPCSLSQKQGQNPQLVAGVHTVNSLPVHWPALRPLEEAQKLSPRQGSGDPSVLDHNPWHYV